MKLLCAKKDSEDFVSVRELSQELKCTTEVIEGVLDGLQPYFNVPTDSPSYGDKKYSSVRINDKGRRKYCN